MEASMLTRTRLVHILAIVVTEMSYTLVKKLLSNCFIEIINRQLLPFSSANDAIWQLQKKARMMGLA